LSRDATRMSGALLASAGLTAVMPPWRSRHAKGVTAPDTWIPLLAGSVTLPGFVAVEARPPRR
jgi:hypothetical protein